MPRRFDFGRNSSASSRLNFGMAPIASTPKSKSERDTKSFGILRLRGMTVLLLAGLACFGGRGALANDEPTIDYARDIRPILARRCYSCHGVLKQEGGLRLDNGASIVQGGKSGPAVEAGSGAGGLLVKRVTAVDETRMPPEGEPLSAEQIEKLRKWIELGAISPSEPLPLDPREHWSFKPPILTDLPISPDRGPSLSNAIDALLAVEQRRIGVTPLPPASKTTLLRRVYLDLVGLPPSPDDLREFLADDSPDAYVRVVDRLLASPAYGERWARHWMDVWRYSDWSGFASEVRYSQRHIWRWRDWIVDSLNQGKPYDRMIEEMLAGDELAPTDPETLRATGFLARNWYLFNRNSWLDNTVEHTAKAFLGLTLNCARCHDHMYDPIAQEDYYRFRAFFEPHQVRTDRVPGQPDILIDGVARVFDKDPAAPTFLFERGNEAHAVTDRPLSPGVPAVLGSVAEIGPRELPLSAYYPALSEHVRGESLAGARGIVETVKSKLETAQKAIADIEAQLAQAASGSGANVSDLENARDVLRADAKLAEIQLQVAEASLISLAARQGAELAKFGSPSAAETNDLAITAAIAERQHALRRAEETHFQAERVLAAARIAVKPEDEKSKQAVTEAETKLTEAKTGLENAKSAATQTTGDYSPLGEVYSKTTTGRRLSLARWIVDRRNPLTARVAINHLWSRHFGEPLVPTVFDFGRNGKPPIHPELLDRLAVEWMDSAWDMKWIHRQMVTSETYCRSSGAGPEAAQLALDPENRTYWRANVRRMEAELVRDGVLRVAGELDATLGGPSIDHQLGLQSHRRSLYFHHAYEKKMLFLTLFDGASENECYERDESIVPQQALALANSPLSLGMSRLLAAKLAVECPAGADGDPLFVNAAFERILARPCAESERAECLAFLSAQAERLGRPDALTKAQSGPAPDIKPAADPHARARENLVLVLLNHHDFVTIR